MGLPAQSLVGRQLRQGRLKALGLADRYEQLMRLTRAAGPAFVARIQLQQLLDRDIGKLRSDRKIDLSAGVHGDEEWAIDDLGKHHAVFLRFGDYRRQCEQAGYVAIGLAR